MYNKKYIIVKSDHILNRKPEDRSKTIQNWSKARLSSSTTKDTIEPNGHIQIKKKSINEQQKKNIMSTIVGYCEKSDQSR